MSDQERRRQAWLRLRAQRRRAGELRARVVVVSVIAFVLLWGIVFAQMATGNDPVLGNGRKTQPAPRSRAASAAEPEEGFGESGYAESGDDGSEYEGGEPEAAYAESEYGYEPAEEEIIEPEPEPAPVITSQS